MIENHQRKQAPPLACVQFDSLHIATHCARGRRELCSWNVSGADLSYGVWVMHTLIAFSLGPKLGFWGRILQEQNSSLLWDLTTRSHFNGGVLLCPSPCGEVKPLQCVQPTEPTPHPHGGV